MIEHRGIRLTLLLVQAFVAVTALAGGAALMIGALSEGFSSSWTPPSEFLAGSPFSSYLVPGLLLAVVIGGGHALAFAELERHRPWALFGGAAAGFALLIWIFVQMAVIPFSVLQAVYFAVGLLEIGLVLLLLDVHHRLGPRRHSPAARVGEAAGRRT
ncbi:hypothetical protein EV187_3532 [Agromyces ramosus]|jgi:hypothetical protein|uniref:Uncharacterized protein n=1 Tax=Agromyces ramosus TaxID=33879 RepID=A0A4Q7M8X2_9MICO|nr:hypothetical protein [Agromyces ramosus]RZS63623.1 hypothetical protein EV187_3532 [Agromyces ramosus]